ncbi:MAG: hypothetical protein KKG76_01990 [Euryarchaeota archaeon]|nr:hypothetical protein [Euryarchaeota archaeon]MBU4138529.1 hypothetical protein [Euryarchaeota archaeon]
MDNEIEIRADELKKIKPNECGLVYDEKRGMVIAVCNKNGEIRIMKKRVEEL